MIHAADYPVDDPLPPTLAAAPDTWPESPGLEAQQDWNRRVNRAMRDRMAGLTFGPGPAPVPAAPQAGEFKITGEELQRAIADAAPGPEAHPLHPVLMSAIEQAMYGKGERHGGAATAFDQQPWHHYAGMHGRGFLTGQAAKKLEEAAGRGLTGEPFEREVLGAIVYLGMAILWDREPRE